MDSLVVNQDWQQELKSFEASQKFKDIRKELNKIQKSNIPRSKLPKSVFLEIVEAGLNTPEIKENWLVWHSWEERNREVEHIDEATEEDPFPYESRAVLSDFIQWCRYKKNLHIYRFPYGCELGLWAGIFTNKFTSIESDEAEQLILDRGKFDIDFEK